MRNVAIALVVACALPLAAAAEEMAVPRMLKGLEKGQWRMEVLEHSGDGQELKPGQKMPVMTMCTDNMLKAAKERGANKGDRKCRQRLVKDASDEAIMEVTCPKNTYTTTLKRQGAGVVLADMTSTGDHPMHMKIRYTHTGACRAGQPTMSFDKDSEQCQRIRASVAKMDPAKSCASSGANREQCEQTLRQHIAQAKAMCQ